ncbi:MAG: 1-acyl-sn-glycerol-3-phosphate acyltransferase [Burkholderiales bacterium]|nr:MAG: 1-acyl-sn-glycerol-3-phosphate acyltransferase [Burkholderiales bacterium]
MMRMLRRAVRLPLLVFLVLAGLAVVWARFSRIDLPARWHHIACWSRRLLRWCGMDFEEIAEPGAVPLSALPGGRLIVANHVNWIDVYAIDAVAPSMFVAKAEIRRWPVIGTLVDGVGTIFIERHRRHAVHEAVHRMADAMLSGHRVAVFPEGTTNDGTRLLRFHANTAEAALRANVPVVPVALRYLTPARERCDAVAFVGDTSLLQSLWRMTAEPRIIVEMHVLPELEPSRFASRHALVREAERLIAARLGVAAPDLSGPLDARLQSGATARAASGAAGDGAAG